MKCTKSTGLDADDLETSGCMTSPILSRYLACFLEAWLIQKLYNNKYEKRKRHSDSNNKR